MAMWDYTNYVVICFQISIFEPLETTVPRPGEIAEPL